MLSLRILIGVAVPVGIGLVALGASVGAADTVRDRIWVWGHPAGAYNASYLRPINKISTIEPVDAARHMGLGNIIFVRDGGKPAAPFDEYYKPFQALDRVYWSLVAAGGGTSEAEREAAYALAEKHKNLVGFILDDFFHEPVQGSAADPMPTRPWLADNRPTFPVTFTVSLPRAAAYEAVELVQTDWGTGDYRAGNVAVDVSADGTAWRQAAEGTVPNRPAAVLRLALPATPLAALRVRFLDTQDAHGAFSVGLGGLRLLAGGRVADPSGWKATASSTYPGGHDAGVVIADPNTPPPPFRAALDPAQLRALRERKVGGRRLPIMAVIYTLQVKPQARAHLAEVDEVCLWTWRPDGLARLEANLAALEKIVPDKRLYLGCYMYDFLESKPLSVDAMRQQMEAGYRWLKAGRIQGIIVLATPNVDVGLDAVEWTRQWIAAHGDEALPTVSPRAGGA